LNRYVDHADDSWLFFKEVKRKVMCQQDTKAARAALTGALIEKNKTNIKTMNDLIYEYEYLQYNVR